MTVAAEVQHASDLRDFMVQTRDERHEANKSLQILGHRISNQIRDEGAIALAQALKANHVVCS